MQLASATAGDATEPERQPAARRLDRAALPGIITFLAALAAIEGRLILLDGRNITKLLRIGTVYGNPARVPRGVWVFSGSIGYDGQFYYRMALDPANLHKTAFGITMDAPYRFMRIGYSALAWALSAGQHAAVPYALVAINVAALGALGYLGGLLAQQAGRHAMWGLLLSCYFGVMDSLARDLTEPLGALCLVAGIYAYRKRHPLWAAAAFGYGVLTRETVLLVPVALGLVRLAQIARRAARPAADDAAWLVPVAVFAAWEGVVKAATGTFPILSDSGKNAGLPFSAALHAVVHNYAHPTTPVSGAPGAVIIWDVEFAVLVLFAVAAFCSLRATTAPVYERLAFVLYVIGMLSLTPTNWDGYADLRAFIEVYLLAVLIVLGVPRRRLALLVPLAVCATSLVITVALYRTQISLPAQGRQQVPRLSLPAKISSADLLTGEDLLSRSPYRRRSPQPRRSPYRPSAGSRFRGQTSTVYGPVRNVWAGGPNVAVTWLTGSQ